MTNFLLLFLQMSAGANTVNPRLNPPTGVGIATSTLNAGANSSAALELSNFLLPAILGVAALVYIFLPLWAGASNHAIRARDSVVYGVEELDLDHDLGKIDEDEWKSRRPALLAQARPVTKKMNVEALIRSFRRARRAELAVEAEVLVARVRKKK